MVEPCANFSRNESIVVKREEDRIDVSILDLSNSEAIIIENKMNNAPDQERQMVRYYERLTARGFTVKAIVYLSLDGAKRTYFAGCSEDEVKQVNSVLIYMAAYHTDRLNLASQWLLPCLNLVDNVDVVALIRQYAQLLQRLYKRTMDYPSLEQLYKVIGKDVVTYETALTIRTMMGELQDYLAHRIIMIKEQKARTVFPVVDFYKHAREGVFAVFSGYIINGFNFTIDVQVLEKEYRLMFFERGGQLQEDSDPIKKIIKELGWKERMKFCPSIKRYQRVFPIPEGDHELETCLDQVFDYLARPSKPSVTV